MSFLSKKKKSVADWIIVKAIGIPNDGGFDAKWIEPNTEESEKASSIIRPSGSHIAPWYHDID